MENVLKGPYLPLVIPETVVGPIRGDDNGEHHLKLTASSAIRIALAVGIYKIAGRLKADPNRVAGVFGVLVSAPAAGLYWGSKLICDGAREIKKGFIDRSLSSIGKGSSYWVGGCMCIAGSQYANVNGWRWGVAEVLNHRLSGELDFRVMKGF